MRPVSQNRHHDPYAANRAPGAAFTPAKERAGFDVIALTQHQTDEQFTRAWNRTFGPAAHPRPAAALSGNQAVGLEPTTGYRPSGAHPGTYHKTVKRFLIGFFMLILLYCIAVFSNIPFVAQWRTVYIETAMSTMNHRWLATAFIPGGVIDEVMLARSALEASQSDLASNWSISAYGKRELYAAWDKGKKKFSAIYGEIDEQSLQAYLKKHPDEFINAKGYLVIDKAGINDGGTGIRTVYGDEVLALDTENAITVVKVTGEGYVGRLAIVKDPARVGIGLSKDFGSRGALVADIAKYNHAVLAINANGFYDPSGQGNGGDAFGLVVSKGKIVNNSLGGPFKVIGFDYDNKLNIGPYDAETLLRDAAEFRPALIINGEIQVTGTAGWGIQPRSAIGQTQNGEVLFLVIDGRAPGYSIGCTLGEAAKILQRYGAYEACNLDGGSSSVMYYNGREISRPSAANKTNGRNVPNGFVVYSRTE